ncbi:MAG: SGNH/GDSL hydrolase family protein [Verrucomicrobia bacterium]|nr:MAG: SGNH/GDSL hydrolase family protein [Verrucomicrobiota bacterium]
MNTLDSQSTAAPMPRWSVLILILDILFFTALFYLPYAWLSEPRWWHIGWLHLSISLSWKKTTVALLVLLPLRFWLRSRGAPGRGLLERPFFQKITLALGAVYIFIAACEGLLAVAGFKADNLPPVIFKGMDERNRESVVQTLPDPELLWRFEPGGMFQGVRVNTLGFRDREVNPVKAPGTRRVICLGCSVTAQGLPGYPQYLHEKLQAAPPTPEHWEALNLGVHGYSSLQGLRLFQRMNPVLKPDVVTIFFGWNDHWLATESDRSQMAVRMGPRLGRLYGHLRSKRIFAFLSSVLNPSLRWKAGPGNRGTRVPPEAYRETLEQLISAVRTSGAVPVLITAPRRGQSTELFKKTYAWSIAEAEQIHDRYIEITRDVARQQRVTLLDLATLFAGPECDGYFAPDGIHFDLYPKEQALHQMVPPAWQPGLSRVATELHRTLQQMVGGAEWKNKVRQESGGKNFQGLEK